MNKKFLLLSAAFAMVSATAGNAKVGGFYVGASGSGNLAQFKVYDASSHTENKVTHNIKVPNDGSYRARVSETRANEQGPVLVNYVLGPGQNGSAIMETKSILSSDENNIAEDTIYKVRPAAKIFVGYNYQIGSNFVVGVELSGGMTFGAYKYSGEIDIPALKNFGTDSSGTKVIEKTPIKGKAVHTDFEMKTKFDGDFSVRLGYLIPGTDGRLALFLRGGVGLINREIKAHQNSVDPYLSGGREAGHASVKSQMRAIHNKTAVKDKVSNNTCADLALNQNMVPLSELKYFLDLMNGFTGYLKGNEAAASLLAPNSEIVKAVANAATPKEAWNTICLPITQFIIGNSKTNKDLYYKDQIEAPSMNKSETKFTWHVGADAEYHFASGLFVRASYTFKYAKGFFAEASTALKGLSKEKAVKVINDSFDTSGGSYSQFGKYIINAVDSKGAPIVDAIVNDSTASGKLGLTTTDKIYELKKGLMDHVEQGLKDVIDRMPDISLGTLNSKLGLGKKSFYHEFSLGFGYKFF